MRFRRALPPKDMHRRPELKQGQEDQPQGYVGLGYRIHGSPRSNVLSHHFSLRTEGALNSFESSDFALFTLVCTNSYFVTDALVL